MPSRLLTFVRGLVAAIEAPPPPPVQKNVPGAVALFMDENERDVLYQKPWPYVGCPTDDRTASANWIIEGRRFMPARRDAHGNWIFRRDP